MLTAAPSRRTRPWAAAPGYGGASSCRPSPRTYDEKVQFLPSSTGTADSVTVTRQAPASAAEGGGRGAGAAAPAAWAGGKRAPELLTPELSPEGRGWPGRWGRGGAEEPGEERRRRGQTRAGVQRAPVQVRTPPSREKDEDRNGNFTREPFPAATGPHEASMCRLGTVWLSPFHFTDYETQVNALPKGSQPSEAEARLQPTLGYNRGSRKGQGLSGQ